MSPNSSSCNSSLSSGLTAVKEEDAGVVVLVFFLTVLTGGAGAGTKEGRVRGDCDSKLAGLLVNRLSYRSLKDRDNHLQLWGGPPGLLL